jgi:hypothetical protein
MRPIDGSAPRKDTERRMPPQIKPGQIIGTRAPEAAEPAEARAAKPALPSASVPWVEPDAIEQEIVQALRFEPRRERAEAVQPQAEARGERLVDPSATLGDLAERLEDALAREVQSAHQERRRHEPDGGAEPPTRESPVPEARPRAERREAPRAPQPQQEPEPRREAEGRRETESPRREAEPRREPETKREPERPSERREEAPVISLEARRREAADPLEDEMARLLGELTGDTKGR